MMINNNHDNNDNNTAPWRLHYDSNSSKFSSNAIDSGNDNNSNSNSDI